MYIYQFVFAVFLHIIQICNYFNYQLIYNLLLTQKLFDFRVKIFLYFFTKNNLKMNLPFVAIQI